MKALRILFSVSLIVIAIFAQSCQKTETSATQTDTGILPARFKVAIPTSLSNAQSKTKSASATNADTLKGNGIYQNLNTFIAVGVGAGDIVEKIIGAIAFYKIDRPMVLSYQSNDDNRIKNLVVKENMDYNGRTWRYMLSITDAASEGDADGGKAMQVFWNPSPIEGIAILRPYQIDRVKNVASLDAVFRIEYSEVSTNEYDSHMIVDIAGLPMPDARIDQFAIHTLKMFVGKKGNTVDVFGNSDHPNAKFFTESTGFDWAFVASGLSSENIGVAEVGIPPSTLDNNTRKVLLEDYSIKNVLTDQINKWFYGIYGVHIDATDLSKYLQNADAPGYFGSNGFIQAGFSPDARYDALASRIKLLTPYNPKQVNGLTVEFK
jgi:hypothetical protein